MVIFKAFRTKKQCHLKACWPWRCDVAPTWTSRVASWRQTKGRSSLLSSYVDVAIMLRKRVFVNQQGPNVVWAALIWWSVSTNTSFGHSGAVLAWVCYWNVWASHLQSRFTMPFSVTTSPRRKLQTLFSYMREPMSHEISTFICLKKVKMCDVSKLYYVIVLG